jgi:nitrous-oxide reductase
MVEGTIYTKEDYETQVKTNLETQGVIDQVVAYITARNFKDFPTVVALVEDATDQLGFSKGAKEMADAAAASEDWQNAMLWANQWWQYQVKAADLGLRAKNALDEGGAQVVQ